MAAIFAGASLLGVAVCVVRRGSSGKRIQRQDGLLVQEKSIVLAHSDAKICGKLWGSNTAPIKVLALHGWLDNAATFDVLIPELALVKSGKMQIFAADMMGHGYSDHRPKGCAYHFIDYVADAIDMVDSLGWHSFMLLGHSLGGGVASFVAAAAPDRVTAIVSIDSLGAMVAQPEELPGNFMKSLTQRQHKPPSIHQDQEAAAKKSSASFLKTPLAATRLIASRGTKEVLGGVIWRTDPRLREYSRLAMVEPVVRSFTSSIQCPILLLTAKDGLYARLGEEKKQQRVARYPNPVQMEVESGGHHCHVVQPKRTAQAINSFLSSIFTPTKQATSQFWT